MSTLLANGNLVQLRIWTAMAGPRQAAVNSCWYVVSAVGVNPSTDQDFADHMDAQVAPVMKAVLNNIATYRGVQAYIHSAVAPYPSIAVPANSFAHQGIGTGGPTPLPYQTCGIIRFLTDRPGPSGRGRIYVPFPPQEADSGGGSPSSSYGTQLLALAGEIGVGIALSAGGRTAVLVRTLVHGKNKLGIYPSPSPVQDYGADNTWATQRRRGSFGRTNVPPF